MTFRSAARLMLVLTLGLSLTACGPKGGASAVPTPVPDAGGAAAQTPTDTPVPATDTPAPVAGNCGNPLFPVVSGASWTYNLTGGPSGPVTYTSSVASVDADGFELSQVFNSLSVTQRWACSPDGLVALDFGGPSASLVTGNSQASFTTVSQSGVTLPKDVQAGDSWEQSFEIEGTQTLPGGNTGTSQGKATYQSSAVGFEDVTVAAGTFTAMRVEGHMTLDLSVDVMGVTAPASLTTDVISWYAPGVGLVKMTQTGEMMGVALDVVIELTAYSLP